MMAQPAHNRGPWAVILKRQVGRQQIREEQPAKRLAARKVEAAGKIPLDGVKQVH